MKIMEICCRLKTIRCLTRGCVDMNYQKTRRFIVSTSAARVKHSEPLTDGIHTESNLPMFDSKKGTLSYHGPLTRLITILKSFSLTTSAIGIIVQPILWKASNYDVVSSVLIGGFLSFFIFGSPALIHWITKKYVLNLYFRHEDKQFTAATLSLFLRRKEITFTTDDIVVPDVPGPFTTIKVKGRPLFVDSNCFLDQSVYIHMMGYDKPLDWELPPTDESQGRKMDS